MELIARVTFKKSPTVKNYLFVFDDKTICIRTLVLADENDTDNTENVICHKFGKKLIQRPDFFLSKETLEAMYELIFVHEIKGTKGFIEYVKITKIQQQ